MPSRTFSRMARPVTERVRVGDTTLHVERFGTSGPVVVMAHGLMGSVALSARFGERFEALAARGLQVVAYDARGHGRSEGSRSPEDYRWARHAQDLAGLVATLGVAPASLCGGSMGAGSALLVALAHPERVDRLVLRAPPPFGAALRVARRTFLPLAFLYALLGSEATAAFVTMLPAARRLQRATPRNDLRSFFAAQRRETVVPAIRGLLRERDPIPVVRFGEIRRPTLVLGHRGDAVHPVQSAERLAEAIPGARLEIAPDAGWAAAHPEEATARVADFLLEGRERPMLGRSEEG